MSCLTDEELADCGLLSELDPDDLGPLSDEEAKATSTENNPPR